jgi:arylsulfatase A-like enzyme
VIFDLVERSAVAERWSREPVVLFGTPAAEPHQVEGFHREAPGGTGEPFVWVKGESELSLTWPEVRERAAILDVAPYAGVKGQALAVSLNGRQVDGFALNDERHRYRIKLPAEAQKPGDNRLRFAFARSASPADLDPKSGDRRELAASLYSLTLGSAAGAALDDLLRREAPRPFGSGERDGVPALTQVGPSVIRYALRLPEGAELRFQPLLHASARASATAVSFRVTLETHAGEERELWSRVLAGPGEPSEVALPLPGEAGSLARVGLHVGGAGEARFAWGTWRAPRILAARAAPTLAPAAFSPDEQRRADPLRRSLEGASVLLVILDAARARQFGAYGYRRDTTPELDRLGREGALFERAFTPAAYTLGAMSSLWTSQHPHLHHSAVSFSSRLPAETLTLAQVLGARGIPSAGFVANAMAGAGFGLDRGFSEFHEVFRQGSDADVLRGVLERWLIAHKDRRFFAYAHFREPHFPFDPPAPFDTKFGPDGPIPRAARRDQSWLTELNQGRRTPSAEERAHLERLYDGGLAFADHEFGRLRSALEGAGLWQRLVVIVAADHGESLGEHGFIGHNVQLYDETVQIPLIVRLPGAREGARVSELVDLLDLAPTVADVFGVLGQGGTDREFRGRSLLPVIAGAPGKPAVLSRTVWDRPIYGLRDQAFKFIYDTRTGAEELYDLAADPGEARSLAAAEPLRAAFYRQELQHWISEVARGRAAQDEQARLTREQCDNFRALGYVGVAGCDSTP